MKSPFVSREAYDQVVAHRQEWSALARDATNRADAAERRVDALTERLLSLKMAGAVETMKSEPYIVPELLAIPQAPPDDLRDLIDAKSGSNLRKRGMMLRQLAQDRADGVDSDTIRAAIEQGIEGNGVPG